MDAEVIFEKPLSGEFEEMLFGSASGNTLWVRFFDPLGIVEWIGKFDCGVGGGNKVTKMREPDKFFVCAGGWVYFVDATARKLLEASFCNNNVRDAVYDCSTDGILIADWSSISLIKSSARVWSVQVGTDGIRNLELEGSILRGLGQFDYDGSERAFTLDLETRKLRVSSRPSIHGRLAITEPWWKFW